MVQRNFILGDEWLYYKLYTGVGSADKLLLKHVFPFVQDLLQQGILDKWFFIRYKDPDPHLRLRFHLTDVRELQEVMLGFRKLTEDFNEEAVWRIEAGNYERELERYGSEIIEYTEQLFFHDSQTILSVLGQQYQDEVNFLFIMKMLSIRVDCFMFTPEEKRQLFNQLQVSFKKEFNVDQKLIGSLSKKYRKLQNDLETVMSGESKEYSLIQSIIKDNTTAILPAVRHILELKQKGRIELSLENYLSSLMHMNINRMFRTKQRIYEMVAYDFLFRYHHSEIKRNQKGLSVK